MNARPAIGIGALSLILVSVYALGAPANVVRDGAPQAPVIEPEARAGETDQERLRREWTAHVQRLSDERRSAELEKEKAAAPVAVLSRLDSAKDCGDFADKFCSTRVPSSTVGFQTYAAGTDRPCRVTCKDGEVAIAVPSPASK